MPALFILKERDALTLHSLCYNQCRRISFLYSLGIGFIDLFIIMPINDNGVPTKGSGTSCIGCGIPTQIGLATLTQTITVQNTHQIVQLVVRGMIEGFPDRSFG